MNENNISIKELINNLLNDNLNVNQTISEFLIQISLSHIGIYPVLINYIISLSVLAFELLQKCIQVEFFIISVPTPASVKISSKSECGILPSII